MSSLVVSELLYDILRALSVLCGVCFFTRHVVDRDIYLEVNT